MKDAEDDEKITIIHNREAAADAESMGAPLLGRLASPQECEDAHMLVCVPVEWGSSFSDNIITTCSQCNRPIHHRPHAPKKPPKVCMPCASTAMLTARGRA